MVVSLLGARATSVVPPTFAEMVARADLVFVGTVVGSHSEWRTVGSDRVIFTMTDFQNEGVLKGKASKAVTLQFLGGTVGEVTLSVSGMPRFEPGERVVLFVEKNGTQVCPLVGVFHGKFTVKNDAKTGREIVVMHNGHPLRDVAEIGQDEGAGLAQKRAMILIGANREPMTLDAFKSEVRANVAMVPPAK
jgi:hypothetical protein